LQLREGGRIEGGRSASEIPEGNRNPTTALPPPIIISIVVAAVVGIVVEAVSAKES